MADTFDSRLKLRLQESGGNSGQWGDLLNQTITNVASVFGFGTHQLTADSDATLTLADDGASLDALKSSYLKITSSVSLTATRVLTFSPNTFNQVKYIENATTGSQSITISQGSGANVTIATGKTAVVYFDGAGSGAAVVDALAGVDPGVTDTLAEVLAAGNATGGTDIAVGAGDHVTFVDNAKAKFGTAGHLELFYNGTHSVFKDASSGNIYIQDDNNIVLGSIGGENYLVATKDGAVSLYYDAVAKLATTSTGIDVTGNVEVKGGQELRVYRGDNATYGSIKYLTGSGGLQLNDKNGDGISFVQADGAVEYGRFDSSGNIAAGTTTTDPYSLGSTGKTLSINSSSASTGALISLESADANRGYLFANASNVVLSAVHTGIPLKFNTEDTTRLTIGSSGSVAIAQSPSGSHKLEVTQVGGDGINVNSGADFGGIRLTDNSHSYAIRNASNMFFIYDVTNTTQRVTLNDSGQFGIGTANMHLYDTDSAGVSADLVVASAGHAGIVVASGTSSDAGIFFGDGGGAAAYRGAVSYVNSQDALYFKAAGVNKLILESDGDLNIQDGNLVVASGHGIDFSANAHESGMTSELLDSYEEGTFTGSGTAGSSTALTIDNEKYTKIGNQVTIVFTVNFSGASGGLSVTGLPFAAAEASVGIGREDATSGYAVYGRVGQSSSGISIYYAGATANASPFQVSAGNMRFSMTYLTT